MQRSQRPVAWWLMTGVIMIIIQILLGGITRLTGSGLSITEWEVVTGTLPPLNGEQWNDAFAKYRQTTQYRELNSDFSLSDFKFIFFWEWFHRFWARLIGVVFLIPFLIFLFQRRLGGDLARPMLILFLLGALQGAVGWIMVASGLEGDAVYVKPTRLALHFILALGLLAYTFLFALKLLVRPAQLAPHRGLRRLGWASIGLLTLQLLYGALMAGHKAAPAAPTWPDINGQAVPEPVRSLPHGPLSLIENPIVVHFIHRGLAYLLVLLILLWTVRAYRTWGTPLFRTLRAFPLLFVLVQLGLGIATVLTSTGIRAGRWNTFEWAAQLHQLTAIFLLLSLVAVVFVNREASSVKGAPLHA